MSLFMAAIHIGSPERLALLWVARLPWAERHKVKLDPLRLWIR